MDLDPLNVEIAPQKPRTSYHFWLNAGLHLSITILIIIDVCLPQWFHYCYFDFGLTSGQTWKSGLESRVSKTTFSDLDSTFCEEYEIVIQAACHNFCGTLRKLWGAGILMIIFSCLCMLLTICYAVLHILLARGRRFVSWNLYVRLRQYGIWATPMTFLMGVTLYIAVSNVYGVNNPWFGKQEVSTGDGLNLAYSIVVFSLVPALHGYLFTVSYLIGRK